MNERHASPVRSSVRLAVLAAALGAGGACGDDGGGAGGGGATATAGSATTGGTTTGTATATGAGATTGSSTGGGDGGGGGSGGAGGPGAGGGGEGAGGGGAPPLDAELVFVGDFEAEGDFLPGGTYPQFSDNVDSCEHDETCDTDSLAIVTEPVRGGDRAVRMLLRDGDVQDTSGTRVEI